MSEVAWEKIENEQLWNKSLESVNEASFLQSFEFGEFHQKIGNKVFRLGIKNKGKISSFCQIIKQKTRLGDFFYIPGGPIFNNIGIDLRGLIAFICDLAKSEKVDFIRFDPRILSEKNQAVLVDFGFKTAPVFTQPACSLTIDLTNSIEELRSSLSDSTRYNIGWVERKGVRVEISQDRTDIALFNKLLSETASRHKFNLYRNKDYYQEQYFTFKNSSSAKLFLAYEPEEFGNDCLASAIVIYFGNTATYLHAASSSKLPRLRAPYLMQWKIIEDAKKSGFKKYDFWGVACDENPQDPWAGVTLFKQSFGGSKICYQKPYDKVISNKYYLDIILEKTRNVLKNVKLR